MTAVIRIPVQDVPPIGRTEATQLARVEYDRFLALLRDLEPDDWNRPTDCTRWTVRDMLGHLLGIMKLRGGPRGARASDHDGRRARHARPFILELTGPAGATFTAGTDGVHLRMDAIEFSAERCRAATPAPASSPLRSTF